MFHHNFYPFLSLMVGICADRSPALHDAVLDMRIIANIHIIQNDGIFDVAVAPDVGFLKDYGFRGKTC